jgi:hypothetical protein
VRSKINMGSSMLKRYRGSAIGDKPIMYFYLGLHLRKLVDAENASGIGDQGKLFSMVEIFIVIWFSPILTSALGIGYR